MRNIVKKFEENTSRPLVDNKNNEHLPSSFTNNIYSPLVNIVITLTTLAVLDQLKQISYFNVMTKIPFNLNFF